MTRPRYAVRRLTATVAGEPTHRWCVIDHETPNDPTPPGFYTRREARDVARGLNTSMGEDAA
jgi:hypothetical protein